MENRFHIGQEVVCIKTHSENLFVKGKHYVINNIKKGCCEKCSLKLDLSIRTQIVGGMICIWCNTFEVTNIFWCNANCFAPIDEMIPESHATAVKELLEQSQLVEVK